MEAVFFFTPFGNKWKPITVWEAGGKIYQKHKTSECISNRLAEIVKQKISAVMSELHLSLAFQIFQFHVFHRIVLVSDIRHQNTHSMYRFLTLYSDKNRLQVS